MTTTEDFLARTTFNNLEASIELALSQTEGFRDEAENFADLARRGIRLVGVVANLSSFPANPEDGDAVLVESETQIYFWDATSSTWKNSQIIGSAIWGNVQGTLSDQTDLQTALDGKADEGNVLSYVPEYIPASGAFDTITYNRNFDSKYVKIGSVVFFGGVIQTTAVVLGTASGSLRVSLPPFNLITDGAISIADIGRFGVWDTYPVDAWLNPGSNQFLFSTKTSLQSAGATLQTSALATGTASRNFVRFSGWYVTDD